MTGPGPRGEVVVSLSGDLELASFASLSQLLASANDLEDIDLVVDLSEVTFMDEVSAGLLVRTATLLAERSCALTFRSSPPTVRNVLELLGATDAQLGVSSTPRRHLARTT